MQDQRGDGRGRSKGGSARPATNGSTLRPRASRIAWLAGSVALAALAFLGDWLSGAEVSFSAFYLIAIAVATWFAGRTAGLVLSLLSAIGWVGAYQLAGTFYSRPSILYWNAAMELGIFVAVTLALAMVRSTLDHERRLAVDLERAWSRLDREMKSVGELQHQMLPAEAPRIAAFPIAVHYATSTRAGGDYYDFLSLEDGRLGILVADASGHGAPAAVLMAMTRMVLHTTPGAAGDPSRLLQLMNARLARTIPPGQFVTACSLVLDPRQGRVEYSLAGHPPPLIARADGRVEELTTTDGPPLGPFDRASFSPGAAALEIGDTLVLYTDGVIEAENGGGEMLGMEWLKRMLCEHRELEPQALCARLAAGIAGHAGEGPPSDDVTILVLQAQDAVPLAAPSPRPAEAAHA